LAQIEVLLRDKDEDRTAVDNKQLSDRVGFLLKRVMESQSALSARTTVGRI
jgi:hypothetical protein